MNSADLYGPPLPPGFKQTWSDDSSSEAQEAPTATKEEKKAVIGPECPPDFTRKQSSDDVTHSELDESDYDEDTRPIGPKLPRECTRSDSHESDCEEDTFGPMPSMQNTAIDDVDDVVANVEKRAKDMKRKLDGNDIPVQKIEREEWMTVPNTSSKNQLGAISRCLSGDTSKKQKTDKTHKHYKSSKAEEKLSKELEKYNKSKRSESLLEMHQKAKKKKKNKEKDDKPPERKPFNRDEDMSLRLVDKSQVKSVIDKAKYLDSRFSRGQAKYL